MQAPAAKQEDCPAGAALPGVDAKVAEHFALKEAIAVNADGDARSTLAAFYGVYRVQARLPEWSRCRAILSRYCRTATRMLSSCRHFAAGAWVSRKPRTMARYLR